MISLHGMRTSSLRVPSCLFQNIFNKSMPSLSGSRFLTFSEKKDERSHSTVDANEIDFFSTKINNWWDINGQARILHEYNLVRVPFIRDGLSQCPTKERTTLPLKNNKILDIGCGAGILSEALARVGADVTGIDASADVIALAEEHKNVDPKIMNNKPKYLCTPIEEHIEKYSNHYDGVVASEVIEHVNNKELFVKCCVEALKPGGRIFFTTPNRTRLSNWLVIFAAEDILRLVHKGTHEYEKFTTPNELTFLLERNNCHVEAIYGITYNPLTKKWDFVKSKQLFFALQAVKLN